MKLETVLSETNLQQQIILMGYRGSIAHGMYVPKIDPNSIDDKDVMGVCVPSAKYYLALENFGNSNTIEIKHEEWDIVFYEFLKFISLLIKGNPNVLSLLWLEPTHYITKTADGQLLLDNKNLFISKQVYHSFTGYAYGQLHRMTHNACEGYMGQKRKQLVEKFGYDTKNAAHLIRLLTMGIEFLNEGVLYVQRKDATRLLEIKRGEWTLDQVKQEANRLFILAENTYIKSSLPVAVDENKINNLCVEILHRRIYAN
jgi:predicted nucleotidyltransferase